VSDQDEEQWRNAADWMKALRTDLITGKRPQFLVQAVIDQKGSFVVSMVGMADPMAVGALLDACKKFAMGAELIEPEDLLPNRTLN
jgi:hypothetical protein